MKLLFKAFAVGTISSAVISGSAFAVPLAAPGPEIGGEMVGAGVAAVALASVVFWSRTKKLRN